MIESPSSIPAGLHVELSRARVKPGQSEEADRWMQMLNDREQECVASLDRERMAVEFIYRLREGGEEYLFWVSIFGEGGGGLDLSNSLDNDHAEMSRRVKQPGWTEAEPQMLIMPEPVRAAVLQWALRTET